MDVIERLGIRIKALRKVTGLTQAKLAELSGISDNFLGKAERGNNAPSIMTLERIASALKVPLFELFNFPDEKVHSPHKEEALNEIICLLQNRSTEDIKFISDIARKIFERDKKSTIDR